MAGSVTVLLACAACGGGQSSARVSLPRPSPSRSGPTRTTTGAHGLVGGCHRIASGAFHSLVDQSRPVPCTHAHNVETMGVHPVYSTLTKANLKQTVRGYAGDCYPDYLDYLKGEDADAYRLWILPLAMKKGDGSWVVRCDIYVQARIGNAGPALLRRTSLRDEARSGHTGSWQICADAPPKTGIPDVDCTRPHRYQLVATYQSLTAYDGKYPTPAQLHRRGTAVCRRAIAHRADARALAVTSFWTTKRNWIRGGRRADIYGGCWFHRRDLHDLPAVQ